MRLTRLKRPVPLTPLMPPKRQTPPAAVDAA